MPRPQMQETVKPKEFGKVLKRFMGDLKSWRVLLIVSMVLTVISVVLSLFGPLILGQITTEAVRSFTMTGEIDWGVITSLVTILIILYVVSAVLGYVQGVMLAIATEKYGRKLRDEIISKIARLPISYFDKNQFGDTLSRMSNDIDAITESLARVLSEILSDVVTIIGIMAMMLMISVPLALVALLVVPLSLVAVSGLAKRAQKLYRANRTTLGELNNIIEEDYAGQSIIKANSHEGISIDKFKRTNRRLYDTGWKAQFFSFLAYPIIHVLTNLSYAVICVLGGDMVIKGKLAIGSIQAFIQYVSQFNQPIQGVSQIAPNIQSTMAAAERVFSFLDEPEETPDASPAQVIESVKGEVEFHQVNFGYESGREIIKDFSAKIEPGMQVAIVGPTGAGKTTIINLLMRFYDPVNGYISIDGVPTREMKRADVRRLFGMVLQDTWLFSGTIEENLRYGNLKATHEDIVKATKMSSIHHFIESLPHGYKTEISEDSDNISAGEKQLLTIARAMVANPPMMILDEATSNVDTRTEQLIQEAFVKLTQGRTSFIIAHRLSTIRNADMILVMKDGQIVERGKHEELLSVGGFYAELYNSQFAEEASV